MVQLSRKQREILEREDLILKTARDLLLERGYLGLTMDRIAAATEYSKGTIYQHFSCKEEVLMALSVRVMKLHHQLFAKAALFKGTTRERMTAIGVSTDVFYSRFSADFRTSLIVKTAAIRGKTSVERQTQLRSLEHNCMSIVAGIIRDAIASGDLTLPENTVPEQLCFALWSMTFGAHTLMSIGTPLQELGISDPQLAVLRNCSIVMDGFQWKPLSHEFNYDATIVRIRDEVFGDDFPEL